MSDKINHDRRRFFGTAAMILAAAQFALNDAANAQPGGTKSARRLSAVSSTPAQHRYVGDAGRRSRPTTKAAPRTQRTNLASSKGAAW